MAQFADLLYNKKQVRRAFETWVRPDYIQHKPAAADGREPIIRFLERVFDEKPNRIYTIHRSIADGDLVVLHYHTQEDPTDLGLAIVDIFRVDGCKIAEHWDVVQAVPDESANGNGMF